MPEFGHLSDPTECRLEGCLARLAKGDSAARDEIIAISCHRMHEIAHRMLRSFPRVRRWDETADVVQNASLRLYRALADMTPRDARGCLGLAAVQIRRELLDLARRYSGPESYAANHDTNVQRLGGIDHPKVADAEDLSEPADHLERWTRLHEAAAALPDDERELFHLAWYMGLKQQEIAALLGCSVRTVKRRWESAKNLLTHQVLQKDAP